MSATEYERQLKALTLAGEADTADYALTLLVYRKTLVREQLDRIYPDRKAQR